MSIWPDDKIVELSHLVCLSIAGRDAQSFLHRQLTNHVLDMKPGTAAYSSWCGPKGRVICDLLLCYKGPQQVSSADSTQAGDQYFLITHHSQAANFVAKMRMFKFRDDVHINPLASGSIFGHSSKPAHRLQFTNTVNTHEFTLPWDQTRTLTIVVTTEVAETGADNNSTYQIDSPTANESSEATQQAMLDQWRVLDIQAGVIWLPTSLSDEYLPQMLGLDSLNAVSFDKGCYPGQEVIARTHYLGRVKRHLHPFQVTENNLHPEIGTPIYNQQDEETGVLVAFASDQQQGYGLAVVHESSATPPLSLGTKHHVMTSTS